MDLTHLIAELREEVKRIDAAITALEPLLKERRQLRKPPKWMEPWLDEANGESAKD